MVGEGVVHDIRFDAIFLAPISSNWIYSDWIYMMDRISARTFNGIWSILFKIKLFQFYKPTRSTTESKL